MNTNDNAKSRLANLLERHNNRNCLLFVGAGFSRSASSANSNENSGSNLPVGNQLAEILANRLGEIDNLDLSDLSEQYEQKFGEHGLLDLLTNLYTVSVVENQQILVCKYKWKQIYTTNYDNVLELCFTQSGIPYSRIGYTDAPSTIDYRKTPIIHINGYVDGVNINTFRKEIRISSTHYYSDDFSRSSWGERFRSDLSTASCVVFIGYSLYDLDVARVLKSSDAVKERTFFIVEPNAKSANVRKLAHFGNVLEIGLDGFSEIIEHAAQHVNHINDQIFVGWRPISGSIESHSRILDRDILNFVMAGIVKDDLFVSNTILKSNDYFVQRDHTDEIIALIEKRSANYFILTGKIGNGKTIALRAIAIKLAASGYSVYFAEASNDILIKEILTFGDIVGPIVIIIDNLIDHKSVAYAIKSLGRNDIFIVGSARTFQYEFQQADIQSIFDGQLVRFSLDELSIGEASAFVDYLQLYGLWGSKHTINREDKIRFVKTDCFGELRTVILDVLNSPHIKSEIEKLIGISGNVDAEKRLHSVLVLSQLLRIGDLDYSFRRIDEILDINTTSIVSLYKNNLSDISFISNSRIIISSSTLAEYIVRNLIDASSVVDVLLKAMSRLDILFENDQYYADVHKTFCRFSFIESAISIERRRQHLVSYFEQIKHLLHCKDESLFWLQYAIARMSLEQYPEAKNYFDIAYAIAKKKGYKENRHLDNQFARFLLESRTKSNQYDDFINAFNAAHTICIKQMKNEIDSANPYRAASNYRALVERRLETFQQGDLLSIFRSCVEIQNQVRNVHPSIRQSWSVTNCSKEIAETIRILKARLKSLGIAI